MEAGIDGLLVCRREEKREAVMAALAKRASDDQIFRDRLARAAQRLTTLRGTGEARPLAWLGSQEHLALKDNILSHLRGDPI